MGTLGDWVSEKFGWTVERSSVSMENFRHMTIDYEFPADTAEAMEQPDFPRIMLNKFFQ